MAYATIDDVTKRYNPVLSLIGTSTLQVASVDVSSIYIADAENFVDAYLGVRYVLPLVAEPIVTQLTSDIALYKMILERTPRMPDYMQKRYDNCISVLTQLRDGGMILTATSQQVSSGGQQEVWSTASHHPVFQPHHKHDALWQGSAFDDEVFAGGSNSGFYPWGPC